MSRSTSSVFFDHDSVWVQVWFSVCQAEGTMAIYVLVTLSCITKEHMEAPCDYKRLRCKVTYPEMYTAWNVRSIVHMAQPNVNGASETPPVC